MKEPAIIQQIVKLEPINGEKSYQIFQKKVTLQIIHIPMTQVILTMMISTVEDAIEKAIQLEPALLKQWFLH